MYICKYVHICVRACMHAWYDPSCYPPNTFINYKVLAYSLGLGTLLQNETRLKLHMKAELEHNDTPYGMIVLTG